MSSFTPDAGVWRIQSLSGFRASSKCCIISSFQSHAEEKWKERRRFQDDLIHLDSPGEECRKRTFIKTHNGDEILVITPSRALLWDFIMASVESAIAWKIEDVAWVCAWKPMMRVLRCWRRDRSVFSASQGKKTGATWYLQSWCCPNANALLTPHVTSASPCFFNVFVYMWNEAGTSRFNIFIPRRKTEEWATAAAAVKWYKMM